MSGTFASVTQPDIRLALDLSGVIREATVSQAMLGENMDRWLGRAWRETVEAGADQVVRVLEEARATGVSSFARVTQLFPSGRQVPIEYTALRTGEGMVAVGKNLIAVATLQSRLISAQHAREQEYWKLREVETRYRMLFDASNEAVVLLRAEDLRILEVNPAAIRAFGFGPGDSFDGELAMADRDGMHAMLTQARNQGRVPAMIVHVGAEQSAWVLRASLMPSHTGPVFLMQLSPAAERLVAPPAPVVSIEELAERLPDALVVIDKAGIVRRANAAFLDMIQAISEGAVLGEHLVRWLHHPGCDVGVILDLIERHRIVRRLTTTIYGSVGIDSTVEISAVGSSDIRPLYIALVVRSVERRPVELTPAQQAPAQPAASQIGPASDLAPASGSPSPADELGRTPLLKLVQDATSVIERDYIAAALRKVGGNRSAAAELLGLSRQTLYVKLGRYGMEDVEQSVLGQTG